MGNKQSTTKSIHNNNNSNNNYNENVYRTKRKTSENEPNFASMNRSISSPNVNQNQNQNIYNNKNVNHNNNVLPQPQPHTAPKKIINQQLNQTAQNNDRGSLRNSSVINLHNELKSKQADLTSAIRKLDSQMQSNHQTSKLYKPNSLLMAQSVNHMNSVNKNTNANTNAYNTLPNKNYTNNTTNNRQNMNGGATAVHNHTNHSHQPPPPGKEGFKISEKLGLTPKFRRKIAETIANRINPNNRKVTN
jgi:hypothetical protein